MHCTPSAGRNALHFYFLLFLIFFSIALWLVLDSIKPIPHGTVSADFALRQSSYNKWFQSLLYNGGGQLSNKTAKGKGPFAGFLFPLDCPTIIKQASKSLLLQEDCSRAGKRS